MGTSQLLHHQGTGYVLMLFALQSLAPIATSITILLISLMQLRKHHSVKVQFAGSILIYIQN